MKIKVLFFTGLVCVGGLSFAEVSDKEWILIAFTKEQFIQFKPKDIIKNGTKKQTWIKTTSFKSRTYQKTFMQVDCSNKTLRMSTQVDYDSKGNFVKTTNLGSKVQEVPPESIGGLIVKSVCTGKGYAELNQS